MGYRAIIPCCNPATLIGRKIAAAIKPTIMFMTKESVKLTLSMIKQRTEDIAPAKGMTTRI